MEKYDDSTYFHEANIAAISPTQDFRYVKTDINPFNVSETIQFWYCHITGTWQYRDPVTRTDTAGEDDDKF